LARMAAASCVAVLAVSALTLAPTP
jgi:hypothetical protein